MWVREGRRYFGYIADINNNPPGGRTVTVSGGCGPNDSYEVPDNSSKGAFEFPIQVEGDGESGTVQVTVDGVPAGRPFECFTEAPPDPNDLVLGGGGGS